MARFKLENVEVLDDTIWVQRRQVNVKAVNIMIDGGILNYMIQPTYEHHDFMQKSGFSSYAYETWIKKVVVNKDNEVELYGYAEFQKLMLKLKLTDEQIAYWKDYTDDFIKWIFE